MVIRRSELKRIYIMDIEVIRLVLADKKNITREVANELGEVWPLMRGWEKRVKRRFKVKNITPPPLKNKKTKTRKKRKQSAKSFYASQPWKKLRYQALLLNDGKCECCGRGKPEGAVLNGDHIKPIDKYPKLKMKLYNIQILCGDCNWGKGNWDETDWREPSLKVLMGEKIK